MPTSCQAGGRLTGTRCSPRSTTCQPASTFAFFESTGMGKTRLLAGLYASGADRGARRPMAGRLQVFAADSISMVDQLRRLVPLISREGYGRWRDPATASAVDELFERVMVRHYDPCYARSSGHRQGSNLPLELAGLDAATLDRVAAELNVAAPWNLDHTGSCRPSRRALSTSASHQDGALGLPGELAQP